MDELEIRRHANGEISLPKPLEVAKAVIDLQRRVDALESAQDARGGSSDPGGNTDPPGHEGGYEEGWDEHTNATVTNMGDQPTGYSVYIYNQNFKTLAEAKDFAEAVRRLTGRHA